MPVGLIGSADLGLGISMAVANWTRVLFEAIDDAVFVHDEAGNILDANPAACRRLGYSREELLQLNTRDIDAPEFAAGFHNRLQSQLATGGMRIEGVHRTKTGRRIHVDINTSAIQLDGKPAVLAVMRDITQRKATEEALAKQSELLQSILDNMSDAIVVADAHGRIVLFNPMAEHVFGPGLLQGSFTLFQSDRVTPLGEFPAARCVRGESFDELELFVRHEGSPAGLWISVDGRPLRERGTGKAKGGVLVCHDITQAKRLEKELRDSQALYESLVQCLPQNIFRKDRQGKVTFCNQRYCDSLKRPLSDLLGKTDFDLFPGELASKYVSDDHHIIATGETLDTIEEHRLPDGRRLFVHVVKTPVFDAENKIVGVQGIFWDVTQEFVAHEAVARSEKRYRQLTEATMDGIVVIDGAGRIALFNPAAERMFGWTADEVVGLPVRTLLPEEFGSLNGDAMAGYLTGRLRELGGRPHECKGQRNDGSDFPVEIALSPLAAGDAGDADPAAPAILAAIRDLTERNKMRAVLVQNEKLASIGLLSAGVAHEINNPLAFVANNLVVLQRDCKGLLTLLQHYESARPRLAPLDPAWAEQADALADEADLPYVKANLDRIISRTRDGIDRVTRIVHSLRGMARTEAPRRQDTRIPDLILSSLEILHGKFKRLGVAVHQDHDPNPVLACVPTQISQVVLNLLVNAFQAVEAANRPDGRIDIRTRRSDDEFILEVEDNGAGIKPEILPRLFDPFFTTKDVGEGTGLGLSISHHIIEAHGGRIEVESTPGHGTRFRVRLPLVQRN